MNSLIQKAVNMLDFSKKPMIICLRLLTMTLPIYSVVSCVNKYEESLIGRYQLVDQSNTLPATHSPVLLLSKDMTFVLRNGRKQLDGEWEAGDNGDLSFINLYHKGELVGEGRISGKNGDVIDWFHCYSSDILDNYTNHKFEWVRNERLKE